HTTAPITARRSKGGAQTVEVPSLERAKVVRRYVAVGTVAWASFVVTDIVAARVNASPLGYLLALRGAGVAIGVAFYFGVDTIAPSPRRLAWFEAILNPLAALLISLAAVRCGGLTSPLALGVAIATMMRCLLPTPWKRALPSSIASAFLFPIVMGSA